MSETREEAYARRCSLAQGYGWGREDAGDTRARRIVRNGFAEAYATRYAEYDSGASFMMPCIQRAYEQYVREGRITTGL